MTGQPWAAEVEGLDVTRRALRSLGASSKDLNGAYREVARILEVEAKRRAAGGTKQQQRAAKGLKASASSKGAILQIRSMASTPYGTVAFMGAARRTGWFAAPRYSKGGAIKKVASFFARLRGNRTPVRRQQHLAWVGNQWDIEAGEGPYVVADAVAAKKAQMVDAMQAEMDRLIREQGLD